MTNLSAFIVYKQSCSSWKPCWVSSSVPTSNGLSCQQSKSTTFTVELYLTSTHGNGLYHICFACIYVCLRIYWELSGMQDSRSQKSMWFCFGSVCSSDCVDEQGIRELIYLLSRIGIAKETPNLTITPLKHLP